MMLLRVVCARQVLEATVVLLCVLYTSYHDPSWSAATYLYLLAPWALLAVSSLLVPDRRRATPDKPQLYRDADDGDWCFTLLPICLRNTSFARTSPVSAEFLVVTCAAAAVVKVSSRCGVKRGSALQNLTVEFAVTAGCAILLSLVNGPNAGSVATRALQGGAVTAAAALFLFFVHALPHVCAQSFTLGEVVVVSQCLVVALCSAATNFACRVGGHRGEAGGGACSFSDVAAFNQMLLLGAVCIVLLLTVFNPARNFRIFFAIVAAVGGFVVVPLLWVLLGRFPFLWLFEYIVSDKIKPALIAYWFAASVAAGAIAANFQQEIRGVTTAVRKYFHLCAIAIFLPGVCVDLQLTRLAAGIALFLFVGAECVRALCIPPVGEALRRSLDAFRDEKDGAVVLSHIHLLVGCALPLFLSDHQVAGLCTPELVSGLLAVGVGDTVASVGGSKLGRMRWPGTSKTVEGTTLAAVAQMTCVCVVAWVCRPGIALSEATRFAFPIVAVSLLEGFTEQIDNFVLPLMLYPMLKVLNANCLDA
ncbi:PREDICTED: dolichol kinase-like [Priapulus caudatus]|uniref:dolichol kinase n=1 Tax=Priapulus caudatus TaxID=37621 RepID=A0ABM1EFD5_PRICU|nr:PREDICTED: dolichol kinase-like [Priapulus caudatus]